MSLITWTQTFRDQWAALTNAAVSVYLSGTTIAARVFNEASEPVESVPQYVTDQNGYIIIRWDDADYPANQTFDIKVTPDTAYNATATEFWLMGVAFLKDSGKLTDQSENFNFDPETGRMKWGTFARVYDRGSSILTIDCPSDSATSILELGGPNGEQFQEVHIRAKGTIYVYSNNLMATRTTDTYFAAETNNVMDLGIAATAKWKNLYLCNAATVVACSPGPALVAMDADAEISVMTELDTIDVWRDEKGDIEYGEAGTPEVDYRTLPMRATNKTDLWREVQKEAIKEKREAYWEDFCKAWDAGEYRTKGAGLRADPFSLDAIVALKNEIKTLKAEIQAMKEGK